jgi:hypothetical protein
VDDSVSRQMKTKSDLQDGERFVKAIRTWQLALLRFAMTINSDDRLALLAVAAELDAPGSRPSTRPGFRFFYNTSTEICRAIINPLHSTSNAVLQKYLTQIDDKRLKRAFAAAVAIDTPGSKPSIRLPKSNGDLWRGLGR